MLLPLSIVSINCLDLCGWALVSIIFAAVADALHTCADRDQCWSSRTDTAWMKRKWSNVTRLYCHRLTILVPSDPGQVARFETAELGVGAWQEGKLIIAVVNDGRTRIRMFRQKEEGVNEGGEKVKDLEMHIEHLLHHHPFRCSELMRPWLFSRSHHNV